MNNLLLITNDYIETLLGVRVSLVQNTENAIELFFYEAYPPVIIELGAYNISEMLKYMESFEEKTIYSLEDNFSLKWLMTKTKDPETQEIVFVILGPYLKAPIPESIIQKTIFKNNLQASLTTSLRMFYNTVPVCTHTELVTTLDILLNHFYKETVPHPYKEVFPYLTQPFYNANEEDVLAFSVEMKQCERRFSLENQLQADIAQGNGPGALQTWHILRPEIKNLERSKDPLRNQRIITIILHTLARKAVERISVHPAYIDIQAGSFFRQIDRCTTTSAFEDLQDNILLTYGKLVIQHSLKDYSPPVRHALNYINLNLSSDIGLIEISESVNVSPNYLSALFNREVSMSISSYINHQRVLKAVELLESSTSSIEDIAAYVGFNDLNYFSRVFKKLHGKTPSEFRATCKIHLA